MNSEHKHITEKELQEIKNETGKEKKIKKIQEALKKYSSCVLCRRKIWKVYEE